MLKARLKAFLSQAYLSKRLLKQMKFSAYFFKFICRIRCLSFQNQSVNMVRSVNKYKISLELAAHIIDRVVKLLHQTEEASERNIENRTRHSKIKSIGVIVSQNYPITDYYKFLHDKNNQSGNNYNFLHGKNNQSNHNYRFLHVSHLCNYGLKRLRSDLLNTKFGSQKSALL